MTIPPEVSEATPAATQGGWELSLTKNQAGFFRLKRASVPCFYHHLPLKEEITLEPQQQAGFFSVPVAALTLWAQLSRVWGYRVSVQPVTAHSVTVSDCNQVCLLPAPPLGLCSFGGITNHLLVSKSEIWQGLDFPLKFRAILVLFCFHCKSLRICRTVKRSGWDNQDIITIMLWSEDITFLADIPLYQLSPGMQ